jgi:hypothetical protein
MKKLLIASFVAFLTIQPLLAVDPTPTPVPTQEQVCGSWINDKLQMALAEMLKKATDVAGQAKDFAVAQLPDVIRQLLWWKFAESITVMLMPLIGLAICLKIFFPTLKLVISEGTKPESGRYAEKETDPLCDPSVFFPSLIKGIVTGLGSVIFGVWSIASMNFTWLQIWIAPKVYLIEYAKHLTGH